MDLTVMEIRACTYSLIGHSAFAGELRWASATARFHIPFKLGAGDVSAGAVFLRLEGALVDAVVKLPFDMTLTRSVSGWVWGNIVFGGLIGLAVDAIDGAFYNLSPEQVSATLAANHASVSKTGDGIYLFAVLKPEPGWVKVGQLQATQ